MVLIGFMGSGKTLIGRLLARGLGFAFVDTDDEIVALAGKPITEIFAESGEPEFRELESKVLRELGDRDRSVFSTGGGIVTIEANIELLRAAGMVVWLDASPGAILERVSGNDDRPLLQTEDPEATIAEMLEQRRPLYKAAADQHVDTDDLSPDEIAYGIAESARVWFGGK